MSETETTPGTLSDEDIRTVAPATTDSDHPGQRFD